MEGFAPFTKMQAVGNDFVVVEETVWGKDTDWTQEAIRLCDRHRGIGGDGLLVVCPSKIADVRMRMFNPDGTEDMCGNGLRCIVRWAIEHGYFKTADENPTHRYGLVETLVGLRGAVATMHDDEVGEIWTDMGTPLFAPKDLPMIIPYCDAVIDYPLPIEGVGNITVSTVNTGSTHTVIWVENLPDDQLFGSLSPKIENHPLYPERTTVLWAKYDDTQDHFEIRIWERGVGETLGCGTGACAIAVLATKQLTYPARSELNGELLPIRIRSKGGELIATYVINAGLKPHGGVSLTGTAHTVYSGITEKSPAIRFSSDSPKLVGASWLQA